MAFLPDQHFSTFSMGGDLELGDIVVGLRGGINTQFTWSNPAGVDTLQGTANQILVNGSTGVPVTGPVTLTAPQNLGIHSAFQVNTLQFNGFGILDSNGQYILGFVGVTTPVNSFSIANGAANHEPSLYVGGTDTNVSMRLQVQNAGYFDLVSSSLVNYIRISPAATTLDPSLSFIGSDPNVSGQISTKGTGMLQLITGALTQPLSITSGTSGQMVTTFAFSNAAATNTVTFPDASGTVAFTSSINTPVAASTTPIAVAMQTTYIVTDASTVTFNLPATIAFGQTLSIQGLGAGGWIIQANTGQNIIVGAQTSTTAGTISSTNANDSINLICTVANTTLSALGGPQGNLTYA